MTETTRWKRRKDARPAEIVAAAMAVFAESGFAGAKLDDIARRAGVAKSSLYFYFETKEELFRAMVRNQMAPNLDAVKTMAEGFDGPFSQLAPMILYGIAQAMSESPLPAMIKMVIGESRNFPDLAKIWHDDLLAHAMTAIAAAVKRAQNRGEVTICDPRLVVFSLVGPLIMAMLYRSVFQGIAKEPPDLEALAAQHAQCFLNGVLSEQRGRKS